MAVLDSSASAMRGLCVSGSLAGVWKAKGTGDWGLGHLGGRDGEKVSLELVHEAQDDLLLEGQRHALDAHREPCQRPAALWVGEEQGRGRKGPSVPDDDADFTIRSRMSPSG